MLALSEIRALPRLGEMVASRIRLADQPARWYQPPGTYCCWQWTWGGPSLLHVLGRKRDGEGFPLTACGMIAHIITDSERIVHSHLYGDEALEAAATGQHPVCPGCYAVSTALNPQLKLPRDIGSVRATRAIRTRRRAN